jgi:hypothetical protein
MKKIYIEDGGKRIEISISMFLSIYSKLATLEGQRLVLVPKEYVNLYQELEDNFIALKRILDYKKEITMSSSLFLSVSFILDLSKNNKLSNEEREYLMQNMFLVKVIKYIYRFF